MPDTLYCYHCGRHHPKEEMRQVHGKAGPKWRCLKSILETRRSAAERDAFGKAVTAINSAEQRARMKAVRNPELKAGRR